MLKNIQNVLYFGIQNNIVLSFKSTCNPCKYHLKDRSLFMWGGGGGGIMGWARSTFLEKRGGPKENFTMVAGGSLCVL